MNTRTETISQYKSVVGHDFVPKKEGVRVFVLVNTLTSINQFVYKNHISLFTWHAKHHPEVEIAFFTPHRMSIDGARNQAAKDALKLDCDYLLFLDDDVMVPRDCIWRLIQRDKDICAGWVIVRGMPFDNMFFKFTKENKIKHRHFYNDLPPGEMVRCDAVGFSLCLIKCEILKRVFPPWFLTGANYTEDVFFCLRATEKMKERKHKLSIFVDTTIQCGHLLDPEPIHPSNRELLRKYYAEVTKKDRIPKGREGQYFSRNLRLLK